MPLRPLPTRRLLRRLRRSRLAPLLVAGAAALLLRTALLDATRQRDRWGRRVDVVRVVRAVEAGAVVDSVDVAVIALPEALVPGGAIADPQAVIGRRARAALVAGDVVLEPRLADGHTQLSSRLSAGQVAVAVALDQAHPRVEAGDRVLLVPVSGAAIDAAVLDVGGDVVTVGVAAADGPRLVRLTLDARLGIVVR